MPIEFVQEPAGYIPNTKFEWYLKNHLGSTMLVYGTQANAAGGVLENKLEPLAAYDYRAFGEMVELTPPPTDKVTENFTGSRFARRTQRTACKSIAEPKNLGAKRNELDDEISLDYFGARYLDPMLGMWTSVDPARQFASPYLYAGNGYNPVNGVDPDGNYKLELNEDNSIKSMSENDDLNRVSDLMERARSGWPLNWREWGSDKSLDFKHKYYKGITTVGVLNGTIMTARDAGNAMWGGYTRNTYLRKFTYVSFLAGGFTPTKFLVGALCAKKGEHLLMQVISNIAAGGREDHSSAVMQSWGFDNYKP